MLLKLIINHSGGSFRRLPLTRTVMKIEAELKKADHQVHVQICRRRELDAALAVAERNPDYDAVIVGGGDGTILSAIRAGLGQSKPLGILPLGTLNLLARDLGLPLNPIEAARAITQAQPAQIDLAEVNGMPFAVWGSLGMHSWIVRRRDRLQAKGIGKWRAFGLAALRALKIAPFVDVTITPPDQPPIHRRTPIVVISNNAWEDGLPPLTRATLDAGTLTVHIANVQSRMGLIWLALKAVLGYWRQSSQMETFSAAEVKVTGRRGKTILSLDGEITLTRSPLYFRCRPRALTVLMPMAAPISDNGSGLDQPSGTPS